MITKDLTVNNWSTLYKKTNPAAAPEFCLTGVIADHPTHPDCRIIITPKIVGKRNGKIVVSSGSEYTLGAPDPFYGEQCVNEDLLLKLKEI